MEYNPPIYFPCPFLCKTFDEITCIEKIIHFGCFFNNTLWLKKQIKSEGHWWNSFWIIALGIGQRHYKMSLLNIFNVFLKDAFSGKACMLCKLEMAQFQWIYILC